MAERYLMQNYIVINGTRYGSIARDSFFSVDTWSFVEEPVRNNGGVLENLNSADRFPTFRIFASFRNMPIWTYQQFLKDISLPEFTVEAHNLSTGQKKVSRMYCQKEEQQKIFAKGNKFRNIRVADDYYEDGVEVFAIENFVIQLVSTNTAIDEFMRTITFNPNGGVGVVVTLQGAQGQLVGLSRGDGLSKPQQRLARWNTQPDGLGVNYALGEPYYFGLSDLVLYAVWVDTTDWVMSLNYSGLTTTQIGTNPTQLNVRYNETFTGLPTTLTREHFTFEGWFDLQFDFNENNQEQWNQWLSEGKITRFQNNSTLYPTKSNITIFVAWFPVNYTIIFNSLGGTAIPSITQGYNTLIQPFLPPTRTGFTFKGWYKDIGLTTSANVTRMTAPTSGTSQTFFAKWE